MHKEIGLRAHFKNVMNTSMIGIRHAVSMSPSGR